MIDSFNNFRLATVYQEVIHTMLYQNTMVGLFYPARAHGDALRIKDDLFRIMKNSFHIKSENTKYYMRTEFASKFFIAPINCNSVRGYTVNTIVTVNEFLASDRDLAEFNDSIIPVMTVMRADVHRLTI